MFFFFIEGKSIIVYYSWASQSHASSSLNLTSLLTMIFPLFGLHNFYSLELKSKLMKIYLPLFSFNFVFFIWCMSLWKASKYTYMWKTRLSSIPSFLWCFILYTSIRRMIWQITYTINLFYSKLFNHLLTFRHTLSQIKNSSIFLSTTLFFLWRM